MNEGVATINHDVNTTDSPDHVRYWGQLAMLIDSAHDLLDADPSGKLLHYYLRTEASNLAYDLLEHIRSNYQPNTNPETGEPSNG